MVAVHRILLEGSLFLWEARRGRLKNRDFLITLKEVAVNMARAILAATE